MKVISINSFARVFEYPGNQEMQGKTQYQRASRNQPQIIQSPS